MDHKYRSLFASGRLGHLQTKNRLVMAPMVRNYADSKGYVTERYVSHVERIARGGVGAIILESSFVRPDGKAFSNQLGIHDDGVVPGLRKLVEAAHRHGALAGIQLFHAGRQTTSDLCGTQPLAPSAIPDPVVNEFPHELSVPEIAGVVAAFGAAARRAAEAGFDFVELHAAHGYLIAQFLSSFSNVRNDDYGSTPENRRRFLEQVIEAVRRETDDVFPIVVRLSAEEAVPRGLRVNDTIATAVRLEQLGVAALHISNGNRSTFTQGTTIPPMSKPDGALIPLIADVKAAVSIPVIAVGKIRTPELAETILRNGQADFIALGRSLLADPDWPAKAAAGEAPEIRSCVACNQACVSRLHAQQSVWCTVNPEVGREREFKKLRGGAGHKLLVVGGGPAGMAAARWGALAGFDVSLHEAGSMLGGQLLAASAPPHREGWDVLRTHLVGELFRLNVRVHLNSRLSAEDVVSEKPWAVILATGSESIRPRIAGWDDMRIATSREILTELSLARPFSRIVVAGGGCAGAQTAEYLAQIGHEVTVLEAQGDVAIDAPADERSLLLGRLCNRGVTIMANTRLLSVAVGNVVVFSPHETRMLPADMVVLCLGMRSTNELLGLLTGGGIPLRVIGDAVQPRKITEAIAEGAMAVLDLLDVELDRTIFDELKLMREHGAFTKEPIRTTPRAETVS